MNADSKIGVIIPTLNEQESIGLMIDSLKNELTKFDYKMIVVDGKSSDKTVEIAIQKGADVIYQKTKGYGEALFAGYFYATHDLKCDILVTIDADGTYSAKDCIKIIEKIQSYDADYIVGRRQVNSENMTTSHRIGNRAISWAIRTFLNVELKDTQSGLFGFRSYLTDNIDVGQTGWAVNTELLTKASELGMVIGEVDISYAPRIGETNVNTIQAGLVNLQMIIRMMRDHKPMRVLGSIGIGLIALGIISAAIVLYDYFETGIIHHQNIALLGALLIMTGIQIFSLGLVADMIRKKQQVKLKFAHNLYLKSPK